MHAVHALQIHTKGQGRSQGPGAANEKHEITSGSPEAESWPERQTGGGGGTPHFTLTIRTQHILKESGSWYCSRWENVTPPHHRSQLNQVH